MAPSTIPQEKIAAKAYEIFMSRGGKPGNDLDDWLEAEKEIVRAESSLSTLAFQTKKNRNAQRQYNYT
jgi:hypothetical protein